MGEGVSQSEANGIFNFPHHLIRSLARRWNVMLAELTAHGLKRLAEEGVAAGRQQQLKHDDYQVSRGRRFSGEIVSAERIAHQASE